MRVMTFSYSVLRVAEIFVAFDSLMKGDDIIWAYANDKQEDAVPHKSIVQWETEA